MKNFIFLSPNFPETYWMFCNELKNNRSEEHTSELQSR